MPISVEVVYAETGRAIERRYHIDPSATVADALRLAAADPAFAGVSVEHATVGVFGKIADPSQLVGDCDRIEIYRPLAADPKDARRARVQQARKIPKPRQLVKPHQP